jgi:hypothetical protein
MKKTLLTTLVLVFVCSVMMYAGGPNGPKGPKCTQIEGVIDSIDEGTMQLTIDDLTVQVTNDTVITLRRDPITFDNLEVGMTVMVCGQMDGDILDACKINVKYKGK